MRATRALRAVCAALLVSLLILGSPFFGEPPLGPSLVPVLADLAAQAVHAAGEAEPLKFSELYSGASVFGLTFSDRLLSLAGRRVVMVGFMAPPIKPDLDFFVLTKSPMALCPFCATDADWPDDIVFVRMKDRRTVRPTEKPIRVEGTLEVGSKVDQATGFVSLVRIIADEVRVLEPGEVLE